jgi:hypothetical protein
MIEREEPNMKVSPLRWDYMKLKSSAQEKKWSSDWRGTPQIGRKIFASYASDSGLIKRINGELKKVNFQKINDPMKNE